jgi:hypothetical protein
MIKRINELSTFSAIGKEMVYETDFPIFPPVKRTPDLVKAPFEKEKGSTKFISRKSFEIQNLPSQKAK